MVTWNTSTDCCSWAGFYSDETTGKVIELDLSCNQLQGKFHPNSSLFQFSTLKRLDLSSNDFSRLHILPKFGDFCSLRHLDLSDLNMSVLNLSHKHLVGCIPKGKQFDTFENNSYKENDGLCGFPLSKECGGDDGVPQAATQFGLDQEEEGDSSIVSQFLWAMFVD
ncbi:hypothetical protein MTR67_002818 [Solanum verrucosum]|uniref:F-box/LRR-repeat protein 15/At3g58940/PEG3-like LRR domain-containing protein n=1 Tax=Solanum verrucosum TaxID=315347 RepID=A0AAF0PQX3_SOLVR|nr:hypothetical protein MTR67_002818 [Solanum verrucosum]